MTAPVLTGLDAPTFAENTVNATPQVIDADVTLTDAEGDLAWSVLTVSGLLAEDRVSIQASGPITVDGAGRLYFNGVWVGVFGGGEGATFSVQFMSGATLEIVESVIEHLTYANLSDSPTTARDLRINVTDFAGEDFSGAATFDLAAPNLLAGPDVGFRSDPALIDYDNDGDLDLFVGGIGGEMSYYQNTGTQTAPVWSLSWAVVSSSFDGILSPAFADLDADGDQDLVVAQHGGAIRYFENVGSIAAPAFVEQTGGDNPFAAFDIDYARAELADVDGDGDYDFVTGWRGDRSIRYLRNDGTAETPSFVEVTGGDNPFSAFPDAWDRSVALGDVDGDGDLDAVTGDYDGYLQYFENIGTATTPAYVQRTGTANPWNGLDYGLVLTPDLIDIDGDGGVDLVFGMQTGALIYHANITPRPPVIRVTVTAEGDPVNGTAAAETLAGTAAADTLNGLAGNDILKGGDGDDTLNGGADDDSLRGEGGDDVIDGGIGNDTLVGGEGSDVLTGGDGADMLNGGLGADGMSGGAGDDIYIVDDGGDSVTENPNEGHDTVRSTVAWTLGANVEDLSLLGADAINGTGNGLANRITGNGAVNRIEGRAGDDVLIGGAGDDILDGGVDNDTLDGGNGNDDLNGGDGDDTVNGGNGDDVLTGGLGTNVLNGGAGNDYYNYVRAGDTIVDGQGIDTVYSYITYTLGSTLENLTLAWGMGALNGTGNALANVLTGNNAKNALEGQAGNDTLNGGDGDDFLDGGAGDDVLRGENQNDMLFGLAGNDRLYGGAGSDNLYGAAGADILDGGTGVDGATGGLGNDTFYVDDTGDTVVEFTGEGTDTVFTAANVYVLGANVENLTANGAGAFLLTGNAGNNVITGGGEQDLLNGEGGNDTLVSNGGGDVMMGGAGDDIYVLGLGDDGATVFENAAAGTDTVRSLISHSLSDNVEKLVLLGGGDIDGAGNALANTLTGNTGANHLTGGEGADQILGGDGDDVIEGGLGNDRMTGGQGADTFVIDDEGWSSSPKDADQIYDLDFSAGDRIDLSGVDADVNLDGDQDFHFVSAFSRHAGEARLIYAAATDTTVLQLDVNGDGKADYQLNIRGDATGGAILTGHEPVGTGGWLGIDGP